MVPAVLLMNLKYKAYFYPIDTYQSGCKEARDYLMWAQNPIDAALLQPFPFGVD